MKLIQFDKGRLDMNYHGRGGKTLRLSCRLVRMGCYAKMWRLYVYDHRGVVRWIGVTFPRWVGEWPR